MSEEQRAEQSRINGAQGQGPTTEEGKAISAQNATKHNLCGKTFILIEGERLEDYEGLRDALLARHQPRDTYERHLVETIAELEWKTARACRLEAESIGYEANRWKEGVTRAAGTPGFETKQNGYGRYISNFRLNIKRIKEDLKEARSQSGVSACPERSRRVSPAREEGAEPQSPRAQEPQQQITERTQDSERGVLACPERSRRVSPALEEPHEPTSPEAQEPQTKITKRTHAAASDPSRLAPHASRLNPDASALPSPEPQSPRANEPQQKITKRTQTPPAPSRLQNWTPPPPPFPLWVADEARSRDYARRMEAEQND